MIEHIKNTIQEAINANLDKNGKKSTQIIEEHLREISHEKHAITKIEGHLHRYFEALQQAETYSRLGDFDKSTKELVRAKMNIHEVDKHAKLLLKIDENLK